MIKSFSALVFDCRSAELKSTLPGHTLYVATFSSSAHPSLRSISLESEEPQDFVVGKRYAISVGIAELSKAEE
jgi:hypothetical protein